MAISRTEVTSLGSSLFECIEDDINNNRHVPNEEGLIESCGLLWMNF